MSNPAESNPNDPHLAQAPVALVAAIAATSQMKGILDVRVRRDSAIFIEVVSDPRAGLTAEMLLRVAEVCGCGLADVEVIAGDPVVGTILLFVRRSGFDFSPSFLSSQLEVTPRTPSASIQVVTADSDESIEAMEQLQKFRRGRPQA